MMMVMNDGEKRSEEGKTLCALDSCIVFTAICINLSHLSLIKSVREDYIYYRSRNLILNRIGQKGGSICAHASIFF